MTKMKNGKTKQCAKKNETKKRKESTFKKDIQSCYMKLEFSREKNYKTLQDIALFYPK